MIICGRSVKNKNNNTVANIVQLVTYVAFYNSICVLEMGQYRFQEYQCIMSKVSRYSNISLLKSIRSSSV